MGPVPEPLKSCPAGGNLYEGACWFLDESKSSLHDCNQVCGKKGLRYDPMTRYVGGDCGNAFKCSQLGHLFGMPGDANKGREYNAKPRGRYNPHSCLGCLVWDKKFMTKHIVDFDGDWFQQYKGQGVAWMPGKHWKVCNSSEPPKGSGYKNKRGWQKTWARDCPGVEHKGTDSATDARCSANQGPPTRLCACKEKGANGNKCGEHVDCKS